MTREKIVTSPSKVKDTIKAIFIRYNLSTLIVNNLLACLLKSPELLNFLMRFEHILPEPASSRAFTCALTIALGYFVGGFVPLLPYILVGQYEVNLGLYCDGSEEKGSRSVGMYRKDKSKGVFDY